MRICHGCRLLAVATPVAVLLLLAFSQPVLADPFAVTFTADPSHGVAPLTVRFTDTSQYTSSWAWSFGDGTTSTEQNPVHVYSNPGVYAVRLSTLTGMIEPLHERSAETTIVVGTPTTTTIPTSTVATTVPTGNVTRNVTTVPTSTPSTIPPTGSLASNKVFPSLLILYPTVTPQSLLVTVDGAATASTGTTITRVSWDWGDGAVEDHLVPNSHTYAASGSYTITVTAFQSDGKSTTKSTTVLVNDATETTTKPPTTTTPPTIPPTGSLASNKVFPSLLILYPTVTPQSLLVTVDGAATASTGTTITRVSWDWGDGAVEDHLVPNSHTYAASGSYTITVTAFQSDGKSTTKSTTVLVNDATETTTMPPTTTTPPTTVGSTVATPTPSATPTMSTVPPTTTVATVNISAYPTPVPPGPDIPWWLVAIAAVGLLAGGVAVAARAVRPPPPPEGPPVPGLTIEPRGRLQRPGMDEPLSKDAQIEIEVRGEMRRER